MKQTSCGRWHVGPRQVSTGINPQNIPKCARLYKVKQTRKIPPCVRPITKTLLNTRKT